MTEFPVALRLSSLCLSRHPALRAPNRTTIAQNQSRNLLCQYCQSENHSPLDRTMADGPWKTTKCVPKNAGVALGVQQEVPRALSKSTHHIRSIPPHATPNGSDARSPTSRRCECAPEC